MRSAVTIVALFLFAAQPAFAQTTEREKQEAYSRAFISGLEVLTARKLEQAERYFQECASIYPNRPVAHYNLACVYSLGSKTRKAVDALRESVRLGWRDLAHMSRDMDLDPIRKSAAYRKAFTDFSSELLSSAKPTLSHEPDGEEKYALLVYVTNFGGQPNQDLSMLTQTLTGWGIAVPQGVVQNPRGSDGSSEYRLTQAVRKFLEAHPRADRRRVFVAGEGVAGSTTLKAAAHNPDMFKAVLAAGPDLGSAVDGVELEGTRAYLVVNKNDPSEVIEGESARNAFAEAGSSVVLERYPMARPFSSDRALLLRGLGWLRGQKTRLPGVGTGKQF